MEPEELERVSEANLTPTQILALAELAAGKTQAEAAAAARVTDRTVRLWLNQPLFAKCLRERRAELWTMCTNRMHADANVALETLRKATQNGEAREWERVAAAKTIVEFTRKAAEGEDLRARLRELEGRVAALVAEAEGRRERGAERTRDGGTK